MAGFGGAIKNISIGLASSKGKAWIHSGGTGGSVWGDVAGAAAKNANLERMMAGMTLESLLKQAGPAISPEQIKSLNQALQGIKK